MKGWHVLAAQSLGQIFCQSKIVITVVENEIDPVYGGVAKNNHQAIGKQHDIGTLPKFVKHGAQSIKLSKFQRSPGDKLTGVVQKLATAAIVEKDALGPMPKFITLRVYLTDQLTSMPCLGHFSQLPEPTGCLFK